MESAEEYRRRAVAAERMAATAHTREAKADFLTIANSWRDLARQAERLAAAKTSGPTD